MTLLLRIRIAAQGLAILTDDYCTFLQQLEEDSHIIPQNRPIPCPFTPSLVHSQSSCN